MENKELLEKMLKTNLLPLAFIGDSVHTFFVRKKMLEEYDGKMETTIIKLLGSAKPQHRQKS